MADITLEATTGRTTGTAASGRLRGTGRIPAVVYGHGIDPLTVSVDARALRGALSGEAGLNALLSLEVDGQAHLAMAKDIQRHPVRNTVIHIDFLVVRRDEVISADVPITLTGNALEVTRNQGVVEHVLTSLTIRSKPGLIPHTIEVDISELVNGQAIRVAEINLPAGVTTEVDPEETVVVARGVAAAEGEMATEDAAEGAEAAAGEAEGSSAEAGGDGAEG